MKTIFLVEDDPAIQESLKLMLSKLNVVSFYSGKEIMQNELDAPDLFVLDKNISGTNGLDLCRFIRSDPQYKQTPVIIISASPNIQKAIEECGADDFIEKPFSMQSVRSTISKYIM
jgi:DNA-binding response OmpR family regulator